MRLIVESDTLTLLESLIFKQIITFITAHYYISRQHAGEEDDIQLVFIGLKLMCPRMCPNHGLYSTKH